MVNINNNDKIKNKKITIKTTENERNKIHEIAKKLGYRSTSKYLLDVAKNPVIFIEDPSKYIELTTNISRIGTNINQVARKVHSFDYVMQEDLQEILKHQLKLEAYLMLIDEFHFFEKTTLKEMYKYGDTYDE